MDIIDIGRYFGALLLVAGLAALALAGTRRFGLSKLAELSKLGRAVRSRRLETIESLSISPRQRLVLIRRDGVEHLIAVGPDHVSVIERAIEVSTQPSEPTP